MNIKLTLQEIIDKLSEQSGQSKKISENFLRILIDVIEEGLKKDGIAKVKGLGTFKIIIFPYAYNNSFGVFLYR